MVQETYPINNSYNKEQDKKNYSAGSTKSVSHHFDSGYALTFEEYKNSFGGNNDPEPLKAIEYFIYYRQSILGEHKRMKKSSWDTAVAEVLNVYSLQQSRPVIVFDCDFETFSVLVESYFNKIDLFEKPCDYSIAHFNSPMIKGIIYHEELL